MYTMIFALLLGVIVHDGRGEIINFKPIRCGHTGWSCVNETFDIHLRGIDFDCNSSPWKPPAPAQNYNNRHYNTYDYEYDEKTGMPRRVTTTEAPPVTSVRDAYINFSEWEIPDTVLSITIRNCERLTLNFHMNESNVSSLSVKNIGELHFGKDVNEKHPKVLIFDNVKNIVSIPTNTIRDADTHSVRFKDVVISSIEKDAITAKAVQTFHWINVQAKKMKQNAINLKTDESGEIKFERCTFPQLVPFSIRLDGDKVDFLTNTLSMFAEAAIIIKGIEVQLMDSDLRFGGSLLLVSKNTIIRKNKLGASPEKTIRLKYSQDGLFDDNTMLYFEEASDSPNPNFFVKKSITQFYETDAENRCSSKINDIDGLSDETPSNITTFVAFMERQCYNNCSEIPPEWLPEVADCGPTEEDINAFLNGLSAG